MRWDKTGVSIYWGPDFIHIDAALILGFLLFVTGTALLGFWLLTARQRRQGGKCPWRRLGRSQTPAFTRWQCRTCSIEAYTTDGRSPKECKRNLRSAL
jgi:hypothetical protein